MADYCDGELYNSHQLYKVDKSALQLILYFDEVEPFNTLGSAAGKHKLGIHKNFITMVHDQTGGHFVPFSWCCNIL